MKTILITGGAGYLGLNISLSLLSSNYNIVIVDTLENSYKKHINSLIKNFKTKVVFYKGNACNYEFMKEIFIKHSFDYVLHMASHKYIDESVTHPRKYKTNNINSLKTILSLCEEFNVKKFAFASSAVVYGNCGNIPAIESDKLTPLSPYAKTKADCEQIINEWFNKTNIHSIIFRFSNPAGANTKYMFGDHSKKGKLNLIPYIVKSAITSQAMVFKGNDHPTKDGTPIRDYIHVTDLSNIVANVLNQSKTTNLEVLNVSNGKGFSLQEIINCTEQILNKKLNYSFIKRNENESSISILNNSKLCSNYNVEYLYGLTDIIKSQIEFYKHIRKQQ